MRKRIGTLTVTVLAVVALAAVSAWRFAGDDGGAVWLRAPELPVVRGEETEALVSPPSVPAPLERSHAMRVVVNLDVVEKTMEIADGTEYRFWTFGGSVPGELIRVREGDLVEFHLRNEAGNELAHNIDMHAVTGPGGGAVATITAPGQESSMTFRALKPGLYVYHCAMPGMVGTHIANGMYGMVLVEPEGGLTPVDHEFYIMQGDFYTTGPKGAPGLQGFDFRKAVAETPDYVLFNGRVGSLLGDNALHVKKGETVRLFVGNGGPNLVSSFHIIGEIMDNVYAEGGSEVSHHVQTTLIPAGGAAIIELRFDEPGTYHMVDHSIFRATQKGAFGDIVVEGDSDGTLFAEQ